MMLNRARISASCSGGDRRAGSCREPISPVLARSHAVGAPLAPRRWDHPDRRGRVEVVALHRGQRLVAAQKVALAQNGVADVIETQIGFVDFDPAQGPVGVGVHLVVEDEGLEAGPEQGRGHARAFVDQVSARQTVRQRCHALFNAILRIDGLGVGHGTGQPSTDPASWRAAPRLR